MPFCIVHKGQCIKQEFGHHQSTRYRMFPPFPQNSHGLRASATGSNQFGWPSPKCPPCAESSWSAPAKAAAHAANVPNKCWTARRCMVYVWQSVTWYKIHPLCFSGHNIWWFSFVYSCVIIWRLSVKVFRSDWSCCSVRSFAANIVKDLER